jgi:hypothetical protein
MYLYYNTFLTPPVETLVTVNVETRLNENNEVDRPFVKISVNWDVVGMCRT